MNYLKVKQTFWRKQSWTACGSAVHTAEGNNVHTMEWVSRTLCLTTLGGRRWRNWGDRGVQSTKSLSMAGGTETREFLLLLKQPFISSSCFQVFHQPTRFPHTEGRAPPKGGRKMGKQKDTGSGKHISGTEAKGTARIMSESCPARNATTGMRRWDAKGNSGGIEGCWPGQMETQPRGAAQENSRPTSMRTKQRRCDTWWTYT